MYDTQKALIAHLQNATTANENPVPAADQAAQIKEYAGEVQKGMKGRINMPAILVLYDTGNPMSVLPAYNFELLFVASNKYLKRDQTKANALKFVQSYAKFIRTNQDFEDPKSYYKISGQNGRDLKDMQVETILNDHTYCILSLPLGVKVDRQV